MLPCYYVVLLSLPAICVCIIEYCMQETAVYGKGAIKDCIGTVLFWYACYMLLFEQWIVTLLMNEFPFVLKH